MRKLIVTLALIAILTSACSKDITEGRVFRKDFSAAHSWIYLQPQYLTICNGTSCTSQFSGFIPIPMYEPDRWSIRIENCEASDGKCKSRRVDLDKQTWSRIELGQRYVIEKN